MKVSDIIAIIEEAYPPQAAEEWDNVGLLAGSFSADVHAVLVALDATDEVIEHAAEAGAELIITHHPLIFGKISRVNDGDFLGRKIITLLSHGISCYAMHTNYDIYRMGWLANEMLKLKDSKILEISPNAVEPARKYENEGMPSCYGIGTIGALPAEMTLAELAEAVRGTFDIESVRIYGEPSRLIKTVALLPGSGKSDIDLAVEKGADVMVTGDIDHHTGIDTLQKGMALIDAGHYGIEHIFMKDMERFLKERLASADVAVKAEDKKEPFWTLSKRV